MNNCVPCCKKCNYAKNKMSVTEFRDWIIKIHSYWVVENGN
jgi:hypothetical protein